MIARSALRARTADLGLAIAIVAIVGALVILSPAFRDPANLIGIGRQVAILGIAAAAMTLVILMGEIDLSVGAVASAVAVVTALALAQGWGIFAVPVAVLVGTLFGVLNGLLVVALGVPAFIATLVSFFLAQGLALTLTGGQTILFAADWFRGIFATGTFLGQRAAFWWLVVVFALTGWLLARTRFGARIRAIGGDAEASAMLGLPVARVKLLVFTLTGALMGLVGMILIARIGNARADGAIGLEFDAIAAAVIGGTRLGGGYGTIPRTALGVLLIGVLNNGLAVMDVDFNSQQVVKGVLVVAVVLIDRWARGKGGRE